MKEDENRTSILINNDLETRIASIMERHLRGIDKLLSVNTEEIKYLKISGKKLETGCKLLKKCEVEFRRMKEDEGKEKDKTKSKRRIPLLKSSVTQNYGVSAIRKKKREKPKSIEKKLKKGSMEFEAKTERTKFEAKRDRTKTVKELKAPELNESSREDRWKLLKQKRMERLKKKEEKQKQEIEEGKETQKKRRKEERERQRKEREKRRESRRESRQWNRLKGEMDRKRKLEGQAKGRKKKAALPKFNWLKKKAKTVMQDPGHNQINSLSAKNIVSIKKMSAVLDKSPSKKDGSSEQFSMSSGKKDLKSSSIVCIEEVEEEDEADMMKNKRKDLNIDSIPSQEKKDAKIDLYSEDEKSVGQGSTHIKSFQELSKNGSEKKKKKEKKANPKTLKTVTFLENIESESKECKKDAKKEKNTPKKQKTDKKQKKPEIKPSKSPKKNAPIKEKPPKTPEKTPPPKQVNDPFLVDKTSQLTLHPKLSKCLRLEDIAEIRILKTMLQYNPSISFQLFRRSAYVAEFLQNHIAGINQDLQHLVKERKQILKKNADLLADIQDLQEELIEYKPQVLESTEDFLNVLNVDMIEDFEEDINENCVKQAVFFQIFFFVCIDARDFRLPVDRGFWDPLLGYLQEYSEYFMDISPRKLTVKETLDLDRFLSQNLGIFENWHQTQDYCEMTYYLGLFIFEMLKELGLGKYVPNVGIEESEEDRARDFARRLNWLHCKQQIFENQKKALEQSISKFK